MAHDMNEVSFPVVFVFIPLCMYLCTCIFSHLSSLFMGQVQERDRQVPLMDEIDAKVRFVNFFLYP